MTTRTLSLLLLLLCPISVFTFHPVALDSTSSSVSSRRRTVVEATSDPNSDDWHKDLRSRRDKIEVEQTRQSLEEDNIRSFLKRKPVKLPYQDARTWVQANLGVSTKEEFFDLVENGNLRTPYIPKQPETYYTETREWISWDHFLTGCFDNKTPSGVKPSTGFFD